MKKMILFFSHEITAEQEKDARKNLDVEKFIDLPEEIQQHWSQIEPYNDDIDMKVFFDFLSANAIKGDFVLAQGDYGATCALVEFAKARGYIPVYATSVRGNNVDFKNINGVRSIQFNHCRFRRYQCINI